MIDHTLARFRDAPQAVLREALEHLITEERRILVHPDLGNAAKLAAIQHLVDEQAPPPEPGRTALWYWAEGSAGRRSFSNGNMAPEEDPWSGNPIRLPCLWWRG